MSKRYNDGSHYENHQEAQELHGLATHAHRSAEQTHDKQDHLTGQQQSRQESEHSQNSHQQNGQSGQHAVNEHGFAVFGHKEIAARAYELWQARGCPMGSSEEDWFQAARELRDRKESRQQ